MDYYKIRLWFGWLYLVGLLLFWMDYFIWRLKKLLIQEKWFDNITIFIYVINLITYLKKDIINHITIIIINYYENIII